MFKIDIPAAAKRLIHLLESEGHNAYVVGGGVRDSLLGKPPHDWDICTSAYPEEVCELLDRHHIRTIKTGLQHGTVTALYGMYSYEITTFRDDGIYSDNRHPDCVTFVDSLFTDLSRRDFTINAIACDAESSIMDPFNGFGDLQLRRIRCVGNPDDRFREDALRIMRALRFASTYGFEIEPKTAAAIHRNKDLLRNISAERIRDELCKILCGKGVLNILLEYRDVMAVIIPELEPCIGFDQNNPYHIYTVYDHIAHAVNNYLGDDISVKLALLLHDIGKPECYTEDHKGGHFHGHGVNSHRMAKDVMERLKFDNKTKDDVLELVLYHDAEIHDSTKAVKRWLNKLGPDLFGKLMAIRVADILAHSDINQDNRLDKCARIRSIADEIVSENQCFTLKDLTIGGNDILSLGVEPGPRVGKVLNYLLDQVLDRELENIHEVLVEEAKRYLKGE